MESVEITRLLHQWRSGDKAAGDRLADFFYPLLRSIARRELNGGASELSLSATDLAHEAFLRVYGSASDATDRTHFLSIICTIVRHVMIDLLRVRATEKRGGKVASVSLQLCDEESMPAAESRIDWLELEQALTTLERRNPVAARIVEMRYFGGMTREQIADETQLAVATVARHWEFARAWLHKRL